MFVEFLCLGLESLVDDLGNFFHHCSNLEKLINFEDENFKKFKEIQRNSKKLKVLNKLKYYKI